MHALTHPRPSPVLGGQFLWVTAVAVALTGCTPTVAVPVAPQATAPTCAAVILATPDSVAGLTRVNTNSQASTAWGTAGAAVTARCGVEPPGPSADCLSITSGQDTVDWIATETSSGWTFVTYGRDPALEVQVPNTTHLSQPSSVLTELTSAVRQVPPTAMCQ